MASLAGSSTVVGVVSVWQANNRLEMRRMKILGIDDFIFSVNYIQVGSIYLVFNDTKSNYMSPNIFKSCALTNS